MSKTMKELKEIKQKVYNLLSEDKNEEAIAILKDCVDNSELKEIFEKQKDIKTNTSSEMINQEGIEEEFRKLWRVGSSNDFYFVSNFARVRLNEKGDIIPQKLGNADNSDLTNIYLDTTNYPDLAKYLKVYKMVACAWLGEEFAQIEEKFKNQKIEIHHIYKDGDNRADNLICLSESIHKQIHN